MRHNTNRIAQNVVASKKLDPAILLIIATIISEIIKYLFKKYGPKEATQMINNPGPLTKFLLRFKIRRHTSENVQEIYDGLLEQGKILNEEDVKVIHEENK